MLTCEEYPVAFFVLPKPAADAATVDRAMRDVAAGGRHRVYGRASECTIPGTGGDGMIVYLLWHMADTDRIDDGCLLGVYSSRAKAEARASERRRSCRDSVLISLGE